MLRAVMTSAFQSNVAFVFNDSGGGCNFFLSCTHIGQIAIVNLVLQDTLPHCFADSFLKFNRSFDFLGHGHCPLRDQAGMPKNTMFRTERVALSGHPIFLQQNQCRNCWVKALALGTFLRLIVNTFLP